MQYYVWDGDTTGRIIVDRVMKAADRGVRVRLLVDDPYYNKASDPVKAALDAHPNVESACSTRPATGGGRGSTYSRLPPVQPPHAQQADGGRQCGSDRRRPQYRRPLLRREHQRQFPRLDVLAVGPVVRDLSGVFERYWNSASTVPIATIVDRPYGAADLDAILTRLRQEIAAADYPYPIDQDLGGAGGPGRRAARQSRVGAGRIIADDPEAVAHRKEADVVVAFIRGRVTELKEELLAEAPYFVLPAGAQATVKALTDRNVRVRVLTNSLASNNQLAAHSGYAKTRRRLLENGLELYELRADTDAFRPGWSLVSHNRERRCIPRPWSSTAKRCSSAASTSTRARR